MAAPSASEGAPVAHPTARLLECLAQAEALGDEELAAALVAACGRRRPGVLQGVAESLSQAAAAAPADFSVCGSSGEELCSLRLPAGTPTADICTAVAEATGIDAADQQLYFRGRPLAEGDRPLLELEAGRPGALLLDQRPRALRHVDGAVFSGHLRWGCYHGTGAMRYPNGDAYCGQWADGMRDGCGRYSHSETGDAYEGQFRADVRCGSGALSFADGDVYEGEFADDVMHGEGEMRRTSGEVYRGQWLDGLYHGTGRQLCADGRVFEGQFAENAPHGEGLCRFPDGSVYEGQLSQGLLHGHGTLRYPDGHEYTGSFAEGMMDGEGEYQAPDGTPVYRGQFVEDVQHGEGFYQSPSGHVYEGQFRDDMPQGRGRVQYADGLVEEGRFEDGCFVSKASPGDSSKRDQAEIAALGG